MNTVVRIAAAQGACCLGDLRFNSRIISINSFSAEKSLGLTFRRSRAALDGFVKCFDEQLVIEGLAQEGHRTCLQRPFTYTRLVVGSDEDDRRRFVTPD